MDYTTVRVRVSTRDTIKELAEQYGVTMQSVLEKAIEAYRRQHVLAAVNAGYAALRSDERAWSEIAEELGEWETTLSDGLPGDDTGSGRGDGPAE